MLDVELFLQPQPYVTDSTHCIIYWMLNHFFGHNLCLSGNVSDSFTHSFGRAMAQAVSRTPLTAEAGFRSQASTCDICGGQSRTGTDFSPSTLVFPCQYHSHQGCIFFFIYLLLLLEGQTGEAWESFRNRRALDRKVHLRTLRLLCTESERERGLYYLHHNKCHSLNLEMAV
jgi:hypothetical protein